MILILISSLGCTRSKVLLKLVYITCASRYVLYMILSKLKGIYPFLMGINKNYRLTNSYDYIWYFIRTSFLLHSNLVDHLALYCRSVQNSSDSRSVPLEQYGNFSPTWSMCWSDAGTHTILKKSAKRLQISISYTATLSSRSLMTVSIGQFVLCVWQNFRTCLDHFQFLTLCHQCKSGSTSYLVSRILVSVYRICCGDNYTQIF